MKYDDFDFRLPISKRSWKKGMNTYESDLLTAYQVDILEGANTHTNGSNVKNNHPWGGGLIKRLEKRGYIYSKGDYFFLTFKGSESLIKRNAFCRLGCWKLGWIRDGYDPPGHV